ncbi:MAG TPA: ammonium transporter, partial [Polyangiaceae bacterium]|nr:ammonium transporter [Polyangiaceae bacterium]
MAEPTLTELVTATNILWTLVAGFMVMFMQAGFALLETGLCRKKNAAHVMAMNFLVYSIGILGFWVMGFAFQMGGVGALTTFGGDATLSHEFALKIGGKSFGLFGTQGFFLTFANYTPAVAALFLFQMVFMDTAATIPTGAMAERWKFLSFVLFSFAMSTVIYPVYANWVWGGGWLSSLGSNYGLGHGHVDFAGSSVVHMTGGAAALVGAQMLGARVGKFDKFGNAQPIPGHNIPMALLGTFILTFGWFGFNAGSTLAGSNVRIAIIATNTMLASAAGAFSATLFVWIRYGKPDPTWLANGMLGGLVAITAPCAFVGAPSAALIGTVAGILVIISANFVEKTLKIDDPVGASSVHGACGIWGAFSLGLFADGSYGDGLNNVAGKVTGLLHGNPSQ